MNHNVLLFYLRLLQDNETIEFLKKIFYELDQFAVPSPVESPAALQKLDKLSETEITKQFLFKQILTFIMRKKKFVFLIHKLDLLAYLFEFIKKFKISQRIIKVWIKL